jgi:hypothetical protein
MGLDKAAKNRVAVLEEKFPSSEAILDVKEIQGKDTKPPAVSETAAAHSPTYDIKKSQNAAPQEDNSSDNKEFDSSLEEPQIEKPDGEDIPDSGASEDADSSSISADMEQQASSINDAISSTTSLLADLRCVRLTDRSVITVRSSEPLNDAPLERSKSRYFEVTTHQTTDINSYLSSVASNDVAKKVCSDGNIVAVAKEVFSGQKHGIRLTLVSILPMRFTLAITGNFINVTAFQRIQ